MGKCTFNSSWLLKDDGTGHKVSQWAKKDNEHTVLCEVCNCLVTISSKGFQAILQHAATKKHQKQCELKLNPSQLRLLNVSEHDDKQNEKTFSGPIRLYSVKDSASTAELIWTMKMVACNYSASSCSGIADTFKAMFPNCIPDGFCLNPKKIHYLITDALAPYFQKQIIEDMADCFYTLIYDETTNSGNKKELQFIVHYWSKSQCKVISHHLETVFIGSATAEIIFSCISKAIDKMKLPLNRLLMLGSDGPNVNKKVHRLMNEELKLTCNRQLVHIGTCNIHTVHNAYLKGLSKLGENAVDLILAIYYFFNGWPSRWEEYCYIQGKEGLPNHKFIKHCSSRWLTVESASRRVIEQWPAVIAYFLKHVPSKNASIGRSQHFKNIVTLLKNTTIKAELFFVISSANIFTNFTGTFQKDEPLVHMLYKELSALVQILMGRFCTRAFLQTNSMDIESILSDTNHLPLNQIVLSENTENEIKTLSESEKFNFLKAAKQHYMVACVYIIEKTSLSSNFLKKLRCFHPLERKSIRSCREIVAVAKTLQIDVPYDRLVDEWKALQLEKENVQSGRIDVYWENLLSLKGSGDKLKYPSVSMVVKAALILSHGNAEVERGFSSSGLVLTDDKASMSERTLSSIMTVKSVLKLYANKPELVPITKELLMFARTAYRSYENYLTEQKQIKEKEEQKKKEAEDRKHREDEIKKNTAREKKVIENCKKGAEKEKGKRGTETKGCRIII